MKCLILLIMLVVLATCGCAKAPENEVSPGIKEPVSDNNHTDEEIKDPSDSSGEPSVVFPPGDGVFYIIDNRVEKTDITGRYVVEERQDIFFEIFEDHAVLCEYLIEFNKYDSPDKSRWLEISHHEGVTWVSFVREIEGSIFLRVMQMKSDTPGTFSWLEFLDYGSIIDFKKVSVKSAPDGIC